ncbi:MAG: hypothetical protein FD131_2224 [Rhodocyclaceae bacterium]|nr:MAG: hypothetical protein FD131_2224 [Rhodocyclaceae bacterium]
MKRSSLALLITLLPLSVFAQTIYKCVDANGNTTYASARLDKNCKVISSGQENAIPAPPKARSAGAAANPSPAGFPRVQEDTQRARDGDRRHILEQELAGEQRNLEQARKDLSEQQVAGSSSDRMAPYRDRVGQHERNIQAIQKELGNLK